MTAILPAGPASKRYTSTFSIQATALDALRGEVRTRRKWVTMPLTRALQKDGYVVEDPRAVLAATSITARVGEEGKVVVTATVPRPHQVPEGELNPERSITVEYVGGLDDGFVDSLDYDPAVPPALPISLNGSVYLRYGYDLGNATWLYQRVATAPEPEDEPGDEEAQRAPSIEDDPLDWP